MTHPAAAMASQTPPIARMNVESMLERIMNAMEEQNKEMVELRRECVNLRAINQRMESFLTEGMKHNGASNGSPSRLPTMMPGRERDSSPFLARTLNSSTVAASAFPPTPSRKTSWAPGPVLNREIPGFYAVIPAGGAGTRLWPLSRENHPKFLLDVNLCGSSLIQSTWDRLLPLTGPSRITVVAGPAHADAISVQLPELRMSNLFIEPGPKDSMAAIGLAAAVLLKRDPEAIIGSFAADHMISGEEAFLAAVSEAVEVAREGHLVTIGIAPSHPATGFGYVRLGEKLALKSAPHSRLASSFKEKPDAHTAAKYLATGQYRWNAGMFVTKASVLMDLLKEHRPELYQGLTGISVVWDDETKREHALEALWPTLEKIAIDHAVAEPAAAQGKVAVVPATFGWDDVGDFSSLAEMLPAGSNKPRVLGDANLVVAEQTAGGIVVPVSGRLITCLGVDDIVIVDAPDALMVTTRARSQEVKRLVQRCREAGWKSLL